MTNVDRLQWIRERLQEIGISPKKIETVFQWIESCRKRGLWKYHVKFNHCKAVEVVCSDGDLEESIGFRDDPAHSESHRQFPQPKQSVRKQSGFMLSSQQQKNQDTRRKYGIKNLKGAYK